MRTFKHIHEKIGEWYYFPLKKNWKELFKDINGSVLCAIGYSHTISGYMWEWSERRR